MYSILFRTSVEFAAGGGKLSNLIVESQTGADADSILEEFMSYKSQLRVELHKVFNETNTGAVDLSVLLGMGLLIRAEVSHDTSTEARDTSR